MDDHHQGSYPGEVGCPGEHDQADGGVVMDKHLPEILPLDIKELADGQGPVEGQFQHIVPPDIIVHLGTNVVEVVLVGNEFCICTPDDKDSCTSRT